MRRSVSGAAPMVNVSGLEDVGGALRVESGEVELK